MTFKLSQHSLDKLVGVHPDLAQIVANAITITEVDFSVICGLRTLDQQKALLAAGATKTLNSRHLTGHAVDLAAWVDGDISWRTPLYFKIYDAMKLAASDLKIPLEWGGNAWLTFKDYDHFQLPFKQYPK